jgi:hypothetical protein
MAVIAFLSQTARLGARQVGPMYLGPCTGFQHHGRHCHGPPILVHVVIAIQIQAFGRPLHSTADCWWLTMPVPPRYLPVAGRIDRQICNDM